MLKPIPPTKYNGSDDLHKYHQFVTEGMAYVEDGCIKSKKHAFVLLHYLMGKAHEFYSGSKKCPNVGSFWKDLLFRGQWYLVLAFQNCIGHMIWLPRRQDMPILKWKLIGTLF
ncbi:hypothetical protein EDC04DRAFT_2610593 [Pisolithus marmoratus]|nr:hypothetical protein EDC04DRAFT_2610593 [Pisolithus marmoratus]